MSTLGKPRAFKSVEELQEKIDSYFKYCDDNQKPYTVCGLAYYLDVDRKTLINYSKDENYFHTIKRAKEKVQMQLEENLYRLGNNSGVIFNLKNNFGWKDNLELEHKDISKLDKLLEEIKNEANE